MKNNQYLQKINSPPNKKERVEKTARHLEGWIDFSSFLLSPPRRYNKVGWCLLSETLKGLCMQESGGGGRFWILGNSHLG